MTSRHDMVTLLALLALCDGNPSVTGGFPSQWSSYADLRCFCDISPKELLNKHSSGRWCETPMWRHCDESTQASYRLHKNENVEHTCLLPLKTYSCHNANIVVTRGTVGRHYDYLLCHQRRQCWHYDNSWLSMYVEIRKLLFLVTWRQMLYILFGCIYASYLIYHAKISQWERVSGLWRDFITGRSYARSRHVNIQHYVYTGRQFNGSLAKTEIFLDN